MKVDDRPSASPPFTRRADWLSDIRMALSKVPPATFRDLAKRRLPPWGENETTESRIAAQIILEHLELTGWLIARKPPRPPHRAPAPDAGLGLSRKEEAGE